MIYRLLGDVEIGPDGHLVELPRSHNLLVLTALLLGANRRVPKTELLRAGWGGAEVGEGQVHKAATEVRKLLDRLGQRDSLRTVAGQGYQLNVAEADLDTLLFGRALREAERARAGTGGGDEADHLRFALGLWRGRRPLANVPAGPFEAEIAELERRRKRAAVRLFDVEVARGNHEGVLDEVQRIAGYYPGDRRLCEQLMVVSYRCDHPTEALDAYERHAAALLAETAEKPDAALRDLKFAIGRGDSAAVAAAESLIAQRGGPARPAAVAAPQGPPRQLPAEPAPFVGREDLAAEAAWLLSRRPDRTVPVVVVSGPGGIGKTALARVVAHRIGAHYPDGQLYAELRDPAGRPVDPGELLAQFLRAFGVQTVPETRAERATLYRTLLAGRRVLVVLDDAADDAQVADLVPANPACGVLVTARRRLPGIVGVHHLPPLEPLDAAAATELFRRVVGSASIDLRGDEDAAARVVAVCAGLPLALRIAGALRVHDHPRPTAELADRLVRQGPEAFSYGQDSVARTIGAGFDRLDESGRRLFLGLGLLRLPSAGLWTAAALLDGTGVDPAAALSQLAAGYMVELVESDVRYRFHDLTREYATRRALTAELARPDRVATVTAGYRALLTLARRAHATLYGGPFEVVHSGVSDWHAPADVLAEVDRAPLDWFEKERTNIRAAVQHCAELGMTEICWDLAVSAHEFYTIGGYFDDWYATGSAALRACRSGGDTRGEGLVLACLGQPALIASRTAGEVSGVAELRRAVDLLTECGERHGRAIAQRTLANALRRLGHLAQPLALFEGALQDYAVSGDTVGQWQALRFVAQTHLDLGRPHDALRVLRDAERIASGVPERGPLGRQRLLAQTRYWTGQAALACGDPDTAETAFTAVLDGFPEPHGLGHAYARHGLGDLARHAGRFDDAERHLDVAGNLARDGADAVLVGRVLLSVAALRAAQGERGPQLGALERAEECFAGCGAAYLQVRALAALAAVEPDPVAAARAWDRVEELYTRSEVPDGDRLHRRPS